MIFSICPHVLLKGAPFIADKPRGMIFIVQTFCQDT
jgi:hypothetical protein